jgi:hypothetical protein
MASYCSQIFMVTHSTVSTGTGYSVDGWQVGFNPWRSKMFCLSTSSRSVLGPTQPPIQYVPVALSPGVKWLTVKLTTCLQLVLRSRIRGSIHPHPIRLQGKVLN